jgi:chemotaxis protein MotB
MIVDDGHEANGEAGENYFVSMTDMMVGVLFIFIIMLMVFALDFRINQENQTGNAKEVAKKLEELNKKVNVEIDQLNKSQNDRDQLLHDIAAKLEKEGLNVQVDNVNGVLRLTEEAVRFEKNKSVFDSNALRNVKIIARVLDQVLPAYAACQKSDFDLPASCHVGAKVETVFVEGHTDSTGVPDPAERDRRNWQLSAERSVNTYREIVSATPTLRILHNRLGQQILSVSGYSSTRPIDPEESPTAWAINRRIDLRFVMEIDNKQRLDEILHLTDEMKQQIDLLAKASGGGP